jgi:hypothetical protein
MSYYKDGRKGGALPASVRDAFHDAVEAFATWLFFDRPQAPEPMVLLDDYEVPISCICGLVWNCTDVMPKELWLRLIWLEAPAAQHLVGRTYACGARRLRQLMRGREIHGPVVRMPSTQESVIGREIEPNGTPQPSAASKPATTPSAQGQGGAEQRSADRGNEHPAQAAGSEGGAQGLKSEFDAAFDNALDDIFGAEEEKPEHPSLVVKNLGTGKENTDQPPGAGNPRGGRQRTKTELASSAAKNIGKGTYKSIDALGKLFGGNKLSMAVSFDPETYAKAKPIFKEAAQEFAGAWKDITKLARRVDHLAARFSWHSGKKRGRAWSNSVRTNAGEC